MSSEAEDFVRVSGYFDKIRGRASRRSRKIVYPQSGETRILEAAAQVSVEGIARPLLVGDPSRMEKQGAKLGLNLKNVELIGIDSGKLSEYAAMSLPDWRSAGVGEVEAMDRLKNETEYAAAMVRAGDADGLVAGPLPTERLDLRDLAQSVGLGPKRSALSRCFLVMTGETGVQAGLLFADPVKAGVPTVHQLAEIAIGAATQTRRLLAIEPHVAFLSLTTMASLQSRSRFKSAEEAFRNCVAEALETIRAREELLVLEPELWDGVLRESGEGANSAAGGAWTGPNTFVFVQGQGAGLGHRLTQMLEQARTVGPVFDGLAQPANQLEAGCGVEDIVDITAITALG